MEDRRNRRCGAKYLRCLVIFAILSVMSGATITSADASSLPFADPAFQRVWDASDAQVASGAVTRSWLWGPAPFADEYAQYAESPGGYRLVQYFDKSRMEINDPNADPSSIWYVTNGLLVREMVSGQIQIGDSSWQYVRPATVPVAGDTNDTASPTYASFAPVATLNGSDNWSTDQTGQAVTSALDQSGQISQITPQVEAHLGYFASATQHNIADVFWNWMNDPANGVRAYGSYVYPMGYPITEPYWIKSKVGGTERNILVQLFERRVLTYTPDNPAGWQVEMGNVGRAYAAWALGAPSDGQPTWSPDGQQIVFISTRDGNTDLFTIHADGSNLTQVTQTAAAEYSPAWISGGKQLFYNTTYPPGAHIISANGTGSFTWIYGDSSWTSDGNWFAAASADIDGHTTVIVGNGPSPVHEIYAGTSGHTGRPVWSPDGTKLVFPVFSDNSSVDGALYVINVDGSHLTQLTAAYAGDEFIQAFSWSPDSNRIAFETSQNHAAQSLNVINADGSGLQQIANLTGFAGQAIWSPTGSTIYFMSGTIASETLSVVSPDGTGLQQVPTPSTNPVYRFALSPTGDRIAYTSGTISTGIDLWVMNSDGSNPRLLDAPPGW